MDRRRRIIHCDFDTLYVSLERAVNPRLRGRPIVVGGRAEERGIVAGMSREARQAGIYPAMPVARARTICPDLVVLPGNHSLYNDRARTVWKYLQRFSPVWEKASYDRIFLDLTGTAALFGDAVDVGGVHGIGPTAHQRQASEAHKLLKGPFCLILKLEQYANGHRRVAHNSGSVVGDGQTEFARKRLVDIVQLEPHLTLQHLN